MIDRHVRDDLGVYALGLLDGDERAAVERHLDVCAECRAELAAHERTIAALADAARPQGGIDLRSRIVARHRPAWRGIRIPRLVLAPALAAAALAAVFVATIDQVVPLEPSGTTGRGTVLVTRAGPAVMLLSMPALTRDRVYEAWVIRDGRPMRAATMRPGEGGLLAFLFEDGLPLLPGDTAAVTIEPAPFSEQPTSTPILIGTRRGS